MPHQCTDCGRTFDDGSKQMLSGCPDCGGNTFQYRPAGSLDASAQSTPPADADPPDPPDPPVDSSVARTVGNAATAVRDLVGGRPSSDPAPPESSQPREGSRPRTEDIDPDVESSPSETAPDTGTDSPATETDSPAEGEDSAQASARSDVVPKDDLPPAPETPSDPRSTPDGETTRPTPVLDEESESPDDSDGDTTPGLSDLREELNDQFESIKVLEPGQYELNLMELYDREEYIIALQEDGKYTIQVPERWEE